MSIEYNQIGGTATNISYDGTLIHDHTNFSSVDEGNGVGGEVGVDFGIVISPTNTEGVKQSPGGERNWVVVGILIGLIVILWIVLGIMLCVPLIRCIRRRMPVSKKRINRRYETIEGWLITKVQHKLYFAPLN